MCGTCSLPPEITEAIIDELHGDLASLGTCSLACREWLSRTRSHLFEEVSCRIQEHSQSRRWSTFLQLIEETPPLRLYVRSLVLVGDGSSWRERLFDPAASVKVTQDILPNVSIIRLQTLTFASTQHLFSFINSLPSVSEVSCKEVTFSRPHNGYYRTSWSVSPIALPSPHRRNVGQLTRVRLMDSFHLHGEPISESAVFATDFLAFGLHQTLEALIIHAPLVEYVYPQWIPVLEEVAARLHTLSFPVQGYPDQSMVDTFCNAIGGMPVLRSLSIWFGEQSISPGMSLGTWPPPLSPGFLTIFLPRFMTLVARNPLPFPNLERLKISYIAETSCAVPLSELLSPFHQLLGDLAGVPHPSVRTRPYPRFVDFTFGVYLHGELEQDKGISELQELKRSLQETWTSSGLVAVAVTLLHREFWKHAKGCSIQI